MGKSDQIAIAVQGVTKRFGRNSALRGIDLQLFPGERLALFGPNGSGKTTLIKILAGLLRPTNGMLRIDGMDYQHHNQRIRRQIGVISHNSHLYQDLSGEENLFFYGRMYGIDRLSIRVDQALGRVGMERRRKDRVQGLSRGMQQRLALARATLHDPTVLLLDEPDAGLDQEAAEYIPDFLEDDHGHQRTVIIATHNLRIGNQHCNRFAILSNGRIVFESKGPVEDPSTLEELYRSHASAS
ncbi:heme ABC exporter ATP-binding protein CcmA [Dehalococcoidia bacterium]|nr:heme ABC exporter ATP-binding protein CcmA [Dehalococcoidia bacterium]